MTDVYLCGHGHWRTIGLSEPFTMVPKGTKLSVYTPVGRYLDPGCAYATMTGDTSGGGIVFPPNQTFEEFRTCPNLTLLPFKNPQDDIYIKIFSHSKNIFAEAKADKKIYQVDSATRLASLFAEFKGYNMHWMACRPRLGGLSTTERGHNDDYIPDLGIGI